MNNESVDARTLTFDEVNARAEEIEARPEAEARARGHAATIPGSEDDDWLKLRTVMEHSGAKSLTDMHPDDAKKWAGTDAPTGRLSHERN